MSSPDLYTIDGAVDGLIESGDISLFRVESQSTETDKRSFLAIQRFIRKRFRDFTYLEVGSHLGGSLFPYLLDSRCASVVSVDPRPTTLPDERGAVSYFDNTTQRMIDQIIAAGGASSIAKLFTVESDISLVKPNQVGSNVRVSLIDAIHTNDAVFRDFMALFKMTAKDSLVAFHDSVLLIDAFRNIETFLKYLDIHHHVFYLPDQVFLVALGDLVDGAIAEFNAIAFDKEEFYSKSKEMARGLIARASSTDLDRAIEEIEKQQVAIVDLKKHSASIEHQLGLTRADLEKHKRALAEVRTDRERYKQALAEVQADLKGHKQALAEVQADRERYKQALAEVQADLKGHKQALAEVQADRERYKQAFAEVQTDLESHKQALAEVHADRKRHKQAFAEVQTDLEGHKQALVEVQADRERYKQAFAEVQTDLEGHKQALAEVQADLEAHKQTLHWYDGIYRSIRKRFGSRGAS